MKYSRREMGWLLPVLAAGRASAQGSTEPLEKLPRLGTKAYMFDELPVRENGKNKNRAVFTGKTHTGFKMECHESDIAPGVGSSRVDLQACKLEYSIVSPK